MAGETVLEVVGWLLKRHLEISELTVFEPAATPLLQHRLENDPNTSELLSSGLKIRGDLGLPFWDSLLLACFGVGSVAIPVLEQARFHNFPPLHQKSFPAAAWSAQLLEEVNSGLARGNMLVLSSRVKLLREEAKHIPMLDFHVPSTTQNEDLAIYIAKSLDSNGGYLLDSGKSYHFYGKSLLNDSELPGFLGRALQFCPLIDRAWIAHQLIEGACGLRISQKADGGPVPKFLCEL